MVQSPAIREFVDDIPAEVEQRLQRLEAAVAALQDTPLMEERVVDRVILRLKKTPIKNLKDESAPAGDAKVIGADSIPAEVNVEPMPSVSSANGERRGWFLFDLLSEFRTIGQMTFDHRYRFSWIGRVGPIVIAVVYIFLWLLIGGSGILGIFERGFDIILVVLLYHILSREARLYRSRQSQ